MKLSINDRIAMIILIVQYYTMSTMLPCDGCAEYSNDRISQYPTHHIPADIHFTHMGTLDTGTVAQDVASFKQKWHGFIHLMIL